MKKIVYIIPGYGEAREKQERHAALEKIIEDEGMTPIHVNIRWQEKNPERFSDYVQQFVKVYKRQKAQEKYVLGFSFGATVAMLAAPQIKPSGLILCSLSPYFIEDHKTLKPSWLRWWKKTFIDSDYEFANVASKVKAETWILAGDKEGSEVMRRARSAKRRIVNSHLTIVRKGRHDIMQKEYVATLEKVIQKLS